MELLEKHSAFFPKSYTQRIRVLNKNLNRYYIFEDKLTSKDKKKLKKYFNQDCKKIFQVVDMEINRSHRQLGYLYDGFWKNFCVNLKTENRIIPWFICAWLIMAYSAYQIHWEEWGDIGKLIQLIGYFLLFIFLIAFFIYYAYSALISKPEDKYNKLFKKFKNDENMF